MVKMMRVIILSVGICWIFYNTADARDVAFELRLRESRISPGRQTYCEMVFHDDVPAPEAPFIKGLNIKHARHDTRKTPADDQESVMQMHIYRVIGQKQGSFTIGPVIFEYKGDTYRSNTVVLKVEKGPSPSLDKDTETGSVDDDISKHIYLVLEVPKTTIFVNERSLITLSIYKDWFSVSNIAGGEIQSDDLIIDKYREEDKMIEQNNKQFIMTRRISDFSAPMAGQYIIKPVTMSMDIIDYKKDSSITVFGNITIPDEYDIAGEFAALNDNAGFYKKFIGPSGKRELKLSTGPVNITVLPLPEEGQPENFAGAIGDFSFDFSMSAAEVRLGGQITLTMTIRGNGNYSTVSVPRMKKAAGIKLYEPRAIKGDNSVVYEQAIRIQSADVQEMPEIVFTFFNPIAKKYMSFTKGPIPIRVTAAAFLREERQETDMRKEWVDDLNDAIQPLRHRGPPFYLKRAFLIFEAFPILITLIGLAACGIARYLKTHPLYVASFVASRRARRGMIKAESLIEEKKSQEFYEHIFRMLQEYLGTRRLKVAAGITGHIIDELDTRGIEQDVIDRIREVFYECYIARYTQEVSDSDEMRKTLNALAYAVDHLNREVKL
ncbi:MAG: BatD family protein [Candidatus Omnitrophota bacterium]